jgi:hypothetical protein
VGFLEKKILRILAGMDRFLVTWFSQVQLFLEDLLTKGQLSSPNPRNGAGFCGEKNSKNSDLEDHN